MQPSRRTAVGAVGSACLALLAGCSAGGSGAGGGDATGTDPATATPTETSTPAEVGTGEVASFEVRLRGPETDRLMFDASDVGSVGEIEQGGNGGYLIPTVLTSEATNDIAEMFRAVGVSEEPNAYEAVYRLDGDVVGRFGIAPSLADAITSGDWAGRLRLRLGTRSEAEQLRRALLDE
jgi:hypothetical protein